MRVLLTTRGSSGHVFPLVPVARALQRARHEVLVAAQAQHRANVERTGLPYAAVGDGPVEAAFTALERASGIDLDLKNFEVRSVSIGEDAQGEVTVTVEYNGQSYRGNGVSTDTVEAAARAYLEVINRVARRSRDGTAEADNDAAQQAATI